MRWAVGMAKVIRQANIACRTGHCRRTQPADSPPGTGLKTNGQQMAGRCFFEACSGQIVCRLCPPAVAVFCRLCACSPLPCPLPISSCPRSVCFALPPVHSMCARIEPTCLQAARLSRWQQQRGSAVAARAPCCIHHTITGAAKTACRQPHHGDCIWAAHAPLSASP